MAFKVIRGQPGEAWSNNGTRVMWQLKVKFANSCGLCIQYANCIAGYWPIPFHENCNCTQHAVRPGDTADPFIDFREELRQLGPDQQEKAVGATNWRLIEAGIVEWGDVVTPGRVRSLTEVVAAKKLTRDDLKAVGARRSVIDGVFATVESGANVQAAAERQRIVAALRNAGLTDEQIKKQLASGLRSRFGATGPGGQSPPPPPPPSPPPSPAPKPPSLPQSPPRPTKENIREVIAGNARAESIRSRLVEIEDRAAASAARLEQVRKDLYWQNRKERDYSLEIDSGRLKGDRLRRWMEERDAIRAKADQLAKEKAELLRTVDRSPVAARARAAEILRQPEPAKIATNNYAAHFDTPESEAAVRDALEFARTVTADRIAPAKVGIYRTASDRAFAKTWIGEVWLSEKGDRDAELTTAIHEIGHLIEVAKDSSLGAVRAFLAARIGDEAAKPMRDFDAAYRENELGRDDDFARAFGGNRNRGRYAGKVYVDGARDTGGDPLKAAATEIVSLGIEQLARDAGGFAKADPEYFKFIVMLLNGDFEP